MEGAIKTIAGMALPFLLARTTVWLFQFTHGWRQWRRMQHCRLLYLLATNAYEAGTRDLAERVLPQIRAIEAEWARASSKTNIFAIKSLAGIAAAVVLVWSYIAMLGWLGSHQGWWTIEWSIEGIRRLVREAPIFATILFSALLGLGFFYSFVNDFEHLIDDCGDRLEHILRQPTNVELASAAHTSGFDALDGLNAREVLGLGTIFSRRELDTARRRMAIYYHPDKWRGKGKALEKAATDAMVRINAAYDELRLHIG